MNTIYKTLIAFSLVIAGYSSQAQCPGCVVQTASCPANPQQVQLCGNAAFTATAGDTLAEDITFVLPTSYNIQAGQPFPLIPSLPPPFPPFTAPFDISVFIDTIFLTSVTGLPAGISWQSDSSANGNYYQSYVYNYGCVKFCGDIACGTSGTFTATLNFTYNSTFTTSDPQFQALIDQFAGPGGIENNNSIEVTFTVNPSTNLVLDLTTPSTTTVIDSGESITLVATSGFGSYDWSTGDTTSTVNVTPADTTTYVVTVTDSLGCEQTDSLEVQVLTVIDTIPTDTTDTTGIVTIGYNDPRLQIYPNPTKGSFTVAVGQTMQDGIIEVLDITGKRVLHQSISSLNNSITLDTAKGLYIVKVTSGSNTFTRKLLIH